jgi:hypothetical protein
MSDEESNLPGAAAPIDLNEVARIVAALEADLARVQKGSASIDALRTEVEALRRTLGGPSPEMSPDKLHRVHGLLESATDAVEVDAIKAASYLTQIGRVLGMT